jgi:hypothetical protein
MGMHAAKERIRIEKMLGLIGFMGLLSLLRGGTLPLFGLQSKPFFALPAKGTTPALP